MNRLGAKRIHEIINDNYVHASVLFFFGISFYNYSEKTLEQVCSEKGLDLSMVIKNLENEGKNSVIDSRTLQQYPIDLVVEYLKHSHFIFIKHKLPYISKLISELDNQRTDKVSKDLKFVFPFFVEDFIRHVYEEEDTLFNYITVLHSALQKKPNVSRLYFAMEKHSIRDYALHHTMDDDEMMGIRDLTSNYTNSDSSDLHLHVIFQELKSFEAELIQHARIENEILFPKALALENEIAQKFKCWIPSN